MDLLPFCLGGLLEAAWSQAKEQKGFEKYSFQIQWKSTQVKGGRVKSTEQELLTASQTGRSASRAALGLCLHILKA